MTSRMTVIGRIHSLEAIMQDAVGEVIELLDDLDHGRVPPSLRNQARRQVATIDAHVTRINEIIDDLKRQLPRPRKLCFCDCAPAA